MSQSVASTTPSLTISSSARQIIPTDRDAEVGEERVGGIGLPRHVVKKVRCKKDGFLPRKEEKSNRNMKKAEP